jgi:hypothetical protein
LFRYGQQDCERGAAGSIRLPAVAFACCLIALASAQAQQQLPVQQQLQPQQQFQGPATAPLPEPPAAEEPPPSSRPGFLDTLGRWFGDSKAAIDSQLKSTQETLGSFGGQARDAAGTVVAVPGTRIVTGRQLCPSASNGAPDCQQGVETLCRAKGFQSGRTLEVTSAQRCPAKVWISGRGPNEGDCRLETYVIRAVCQ